MKIVIVLGGLPEEKPGKLMRGTENKSRIQRESESVYRESRHIEEPEHGQCPTDQSDSEGEQHRSRASTAVCSYSNFSLLWYEGLPCALWSLISRIYNLKSGPTWHHRHRYSNTMHINNDLFIHVKPHIFI